MWYNDKKIALIPAYQPTEELLPFLESLTGAGFTSVVVDDGSGQDYAPIFEEAATCAAVLTHDVNRGKGCALKTGLGYIHEHFSESSVIVTLDADGQHALDDAVKICDASKRNPGTLILGSRNFGNNVPLRSRFGNLVTRAVYRVTTGTHVSDTQTGLRAFDGSLIPFLLKIPGERYEYEMNVLLACSREKIPIWEIGIRTIYINNNASSHFDTVKDSCRVYREIFKFAASSFLGFLVDYGAYSLLTVATGGLGTAVSIPLSNITARVISASVNYTVNKNLVFKSKDNAVKTAAQYFLLAGFILLANTVLLSVLVETAGINKYAAKIFTEITFFTFSWLAQKFLIFRKNGREKAACPGVGGEKGGELQ